MLKWAMDLAQFIQRVIEKVAQSKFKITYTLTGTIQYDPTQAILGHLRLCLQVAQSDPKFHSTQKASFKSSWLQAVKLIKKEDPIFFDEFKDQDQAREELKKLISK